jgi:hypothetical protein
MVPEAYRLEHVVVRAIERLEGARRSFAGQPERAAAELRRICEETADAAAGEYREVAVDPDPEVHVAFLRREMLDTFLPRYERLATAMTAREEGGYGLGRVAEPAGRLLLLAIGLVIVWLELRTGLIARGFFTVPALLALPFLPDLLAALWRRRWRNELQALADDMARIQDNAVAYERPERLQTEPLSPATPPRKTPAGQQEGH